MISQWHDRRKYLLLPFISLIIFFIFPWGQYELMYLKPDTLLFGLIHFSLTPQPWSIEDNYSFLLLPSIIHWILFVPVLLAARILWQKSLLSRLLLIYLLMVIIFYALIPELQGPRHRVQIIFVIAWMQFHFLWIFTRKAVRHDTTSDYSGNIKQEVKVL